MKAVILAGGLGTRLTEETMTKPKPMVEIGSRPILWHIMKIYSAHGVNDFIVCLGYKGYLIKEYFANYFLHMSDVTFDLPSNQMQALHPSVEPWRVTLVDTGEHTQTGGRLRRVRDYLDDGNDADFCLTYGDGVGNIDISKSIEFHRNNRRLATVTAVRPPGRFGALSLDSDRVVRFQEKPENGSGWINGGFFVLNRKVIDYIDSDDTIWERDPMERIASDGELSAYFHWGFWQPMDTLRDLRYLQGLWDSGDAPWTVWI